MKFAKRLLAALLLATPLTAAALDGAWHLPHALNDTNTEISFEVDSTWHLVKGATGDVRGRVWLDDPQDFRSVRAEIALPVAKFNTDSRRRDARLLEVMHAGQHPDVKFALNEVTNLCNPAAIAPDSGCPLELAGILEINNVRKNIQAAANLSASGGEYLISGHFPVRWAEYGVDDPSILIAKLDPEVQISFRVHLKPQPREGS